MLWKEIYKNLDFCIDKKFFKNDEDFFKVLFNTLNAESISSEEEMMDLFEQDFKEKGNDGIFNFLDIVCKILDFYINVLNNRLHENNTFTNFFNQNNQKKKVESLLQVLFYAQKISSNSRFLLFKIILESHNIGDTQANFQIIQEIWCLIRIVYIEETLNSNKSNIIRNNMLKVIKDLNKDWNLLKYFNDRKDTDYLINKKFINDALQPKDNEESKFIIYLYCYLNEHETLQSYNQKQYKENELEHMFPTSWKNYWEDKYFTKEEITSYIENELEKSQFKNINFENIKIEILQKENLELIDAPNHKQKDSLLQFIGNKWVLHAASNVKASNKNFEFKKDNYQNDSNIIKLPKNENSEIGLNKFEDFTYKEIITRSLRIVDGIFGKFYNTWDDI